MAELTLFDLNKFEGHVKELSLEDSKSVFGGRDVEYTNSDRRKEELPDELTIHTNEPTEEECEEAEESEFGTYRRGCD